MICANCSRLSTGYAISLYLVQSNRTIFYLCGLLSSRHHSWSFVRVCVILCVFATLYGDLYIYDYILSHVSAPIQMLFYSSLTLSGS